jgi:uncharacterized damage-inducible protein DinB
MASTIARDRAWRGSLRIDGGCFSVEARGRGMRVDIGAPLPENVSKLLAFYRERKDILTMSAAALLVTLFQYQAWANDDLVVKLGQLDPERHGGERHTALRLVNHCHVVNRIFAAHLRGASHDFVTDNTTETPEPADLRAAMAITDRWYIDYAETVTPDQLAEPLPFTFTDGDRGCMSRQEMLMHVITHGGYHRGEVGRILAGLSVSPPWDTFAVFLHRTEPSRRLEIAGFDGLNAASVLSS